MYYAHEAKMLFFAFVYYAGLLYERTSQPLLPPLPVKYDHSDLRRLLGKDHAARIRVRQYSPAFFDNKLLTKGNVSFMTDFVFHT